MRIALSCSLAAALAALSCAPAPQIPPPYEPGYAEYMVGAQAHDQRAAEHERLAKAADSMHGTSASYGCPDMVLNDQLNGGFGAPLTTYQPCWDVGEEAAEQHRALAEEEAQAAREDRVLATQLVRAEVDACRGIPQAERAHSVFAHRKEIDHVLPSYSAADLHGVWVIFKPVSGLTADWVRRDIACQRARWAVVGGKVVDTPVDPTLVPASNVQVFQRGDHVEVLVTTATTPDAEIALARARGELVPSGEATAGR